MADKLVLDSTVESNNIEDGDTLTVMHQKTNLPKLAAKRVAQGTTNSSTKHDVSKILTQGKRNHDESMMGHTVTHERLEQIEKSVADIKKGN